MDKNGSLMVLFKVAHQSYSYYMINKERLTLRLTALLIQRYKSLRASAALF